MFQVWGCFPVLVDNTPLIGPLLISQLDAITLLRTMGMNPTDADLNVLFDRMKVRLYTISVHVLNDSFLDRLSNFIMGGDSESNKVVRVLLGSVFSSNIFLSSFSFSWLH